MLIKPLQEILVPLRVKARRLWPKNCIQLLITSTPREFAYGQMSAVNNNLFFVFFWVLLEFCAMFVASGNIFLITM